jgi:hypothetical protein
MQQTDLAQIPQLTSSAMMKSNLSYLKSKSLKRLLVTMGILTMTAPVFADPIESIEIRRLYGSPAKLLIYAATWDARTADLGLKLVKTITPLQLSCIHTQLALLRAVVQKPENQEPLKALGPMKRLEISVNIPTTDATLARLRSGLYFADGTFGISFYMVDTEYNVCRGLMSDIDLDRELLKLESTANGQNLQSEADVTTAIDATKSDVDSIFDLITKKR